MHFYKHCTDPNKKIVDTVGKSILQFLFLHSLFFFSLVYISWQPIQPWGCRVNKKRKKINENEAEAEIFTWTAVNRKSKIRTITRLVINFFYVSNKHLCLDREHGYSSELFLFPSSCSEPMFSEFVKLTRFQKPSVF